jgi:hypothetical protein
MAKSSVIIIMKGVIYMYKEFPTSNGRVKTTNTKFKLNDIVFIDRNKFTSQEKATYVNTDITKDNKHRITNILAEETIYLHYTCKESRLDYEPIYEIDNGGLVREHILVRSDYK